MRKLVVTEFMSLDGVVEAPGGEDDFPHGAWTMPFWSDEIGEFKDEELQASEILLVYRRSDVPLGKPSFGTETNEDFPYED